MAEEIVLFSGELGMQRVRVWLEWQVGGVSLHSHDIGPGLEHAFGTDEIETVLEIAASELPDLSRALGTEPIDGCCRRWPRCPLSR